MLTSNHSGLQIGHIYKVISEYVVFFYVESGMEWEILDIREFRTERNAKGKILTVLEKRQISNKMSFKFTVYKILLDGRISMLIIEKDDFETEICEKWFKHIK